jgi:hypothetical protein
VPDLTNPSFVELMCDVEKTAGAAGYSVIFSKFQRGSGPRTRKFGDAVLTAAERIGVENLKYHAQGQRPASIERIAISELSRAALTSSSTFSMMISSTGARQAAGWPYGIIAPPPSYPPSFSTRNDGM